MKLAVRSLRPPRRRKQKSLRFFGKQTVLNVHETGLTIEGLIPDVWYPLFMRVLYRAVSEWTMRTIPFSQIRKCKVNAKSRSRIWAVIVWSAVFAYLIRSLWWSPALYVLSVLANAVGTYFLSRWLMRDSVDIVYETKGNQLNTLRLRFPREADQMLLFQELSRHRLDAAAPTLAKVAKDITERRSIFSKILGKGRNKP